MADLRLSIAMATYNGGKYLEEQLLSFVRQTRPPDEVVICDDGSKDDTLAVARSFAATAPFAVVIEENPENLGYSKNFSKAAALCTGDVIFFSDQDDSWYPSKIERTLEVLSGNTAVVINNCLFVDAAGGSCGTKLANIRSLGLTDRSFVAGCCTAMTRDFASLALPVPGGIAYDTWTSELAYILGVRRVIEEPLQTYRRHGGNISQSVLNKEGATRWHLLGVYGLKDPRLGWSQEIGKLQAIRTRITERRALAGKVAGAERVEEALAALRREEDTYRQRLALLDKPRARRLPEVLRMWRDGHYDEFSGWMSAAKDLIRP